MDTCLLIQAISTCQLTTKSNKSTVTLRKNVEKIIHQKGVGSIEIKVEEENLYRDADATMMRQRKKKAAIKTTLSTVAEI